MGCGWNEKTKQEEAGSSGDAPWNRTTGCVVTLGQLIGH